MVDTFFSRTIILGRLSQETIINNRNEVYINQPGGNLLYASYGFALWGERAGLISCVGQNFPAEWLIQIAERGFDIRGIFRNNKEIDARRFYASQGDHISIENPQKFFTNLGLPFPKELLGYSSEQTRIDNRRSGSFFTIMPDDIPAEYLNASILLVCPVDFITHSLVPAFFRLKARGEVLIHPSRSYMHSSFYYDFPPIVRGASAVIASELNWLNLFLGRSDDVWEIAETVAEFGVQNVVVLTKERGTLLFDNQSQKRFVFPVYPCDMVDPIGVDSAFCGGFLAGYAKYRDPLRATQMGIVSASIKMQGSTAAYLLDALPELALARLEVLQGQIQIT